MSEKKGNFYCQGNYYKTPDDFFSAANAHMKKHLDEEDIKKYMERLAKEIWLNLQLYGKCLTVADLYSSNISRNVHIATSDLINVRGNEGVE